MFVLYFVFISDPRGHATDADGGSEGWDQARSRGRAGRGHGGRGRARRRAAQETPPARHGRQQPYVAFFRQSFNVHKNKKFCKCYLYELTVSI